MFDALQLQKQFEAYLENHLFAQAPSELYKPANYILGLGGKRMRPVFLLLAYQLFRKKTDRALPAAFAIELFHNFTLLHDDIMDEAPLRRGQPTVHSMWGVNAAILSGDVMLIEAYEFLRRSAAKGTLPAVLVVFNRVAKGVCEGQQMDMNFEKRTDVSMPEYLRMIELKTAVLAGGALEIGALLGGASAADAERLYQFGVDVGLAFQIHDDLLDAFGDPALFGKKTGGDIAQQKKTFLILKALEIADEATAAQLRDLYFSQRDPFGTKNLDEAAKIRQVLGLFEKTGVAAVAEAAKEDFYKKALGNLAAVAAPEAGKRELEKAAAGLMNRQS